MGTTAEKLTYLNTTKAQIKDGINRLGGELTNLDTFREYKEALDDIYDKLPKVTGTGSDIYLTPTLQGGLNILPIGNTEQDTYTRKNLLSSENINTTVAGVTYQSQTDGTILATGTKSGGSYANLTNNIVTLENDTYSSTMFLLNGTIRKDGVGTSPSVYLVNQDNTSKTYNIGEIGQAGKTQIIEAGTYFIRVAVWSDNILFTNAKIGFMLVKGSTIPTTFEKYVGGIPSPNPSYPQDVKVVTGDNQVVVSNSDNTQSQTYTLHLGSLELCKIGDYQDVILGTKDNWKVVRNVGHIVSYNGETITTDYISTTGELSTGAEVYYGLSISTEETITDTTLINELNELQDLLSYDGTTNITITSDSDNAQMIAQVSALKGE